MLALFQSSVEAVLETASVEPDPSRLSDLAQLYYYVCIDEALFEKALALFSASLSKIGDRLHGVPYPERFRRLVSYFNQTRSLAEQCFQRNARVANAILDAFKSFNDAHEHDISQAAACFCDSVVLQCQPLDVPVF